MLGIGHFPELLIVLVVALIIFGPGKLPEIGRSLGQGMRGFRQATSELERTLSGTLDGTLGHPTTLPSTPPAVEPSLMTAGGPVADPVQPVVGGEPGIARMPSMADEPATMHPSAGPMATDAPVHAGYAPAPLPSYGRTAGAGADFLSSGAGGSAPSIASQSVGGSEHLAPASRNVLATAGAGANAELHQRTRKVGLPKDGAAAAQQPTASASDPAASEPTA